MTPSPAPRGELTPEIRDLLNRYGYAEREDGRIHERAATGATTWGAAEKSERCALEARAALESAILALSGPPSGETPDDKREMPWAASAWMWMEPHPAPSGEALEALERMGAGWLTPRSQHHDGCTCAMCANHELVRRALSGLPQPTPERLREVRAMEAFIDAIWFNVLCARPLEPPPALLDAWAALDSALGVWYWSCQPGCLNPQNPEAAPPSPPKEG